MTKSNEGWQPGYCFNGKEYIMPLDKMIRQRLAAAGMDDVPTRHLVADILNLVYSEVKGWTNRVDDAIRIPDVIWETEWLIRPTPKEIEEHEYHA